MRWLCAIVLMVAACLPLPAGAQEGTDWRETAVGMHMLYPQEARDVGGGTQFIPSTTVLRLTEAEARQMMTERGFEPMFPTVLPEGYELVWIQAYFAGEHEELAPYLVGEGELVRDVDGRDARRWTVPAPLFEDTRGIGMRYQRDNGQELTVWFYIRPVGQTSGEVAWMTQGHRKESMQLENGLYAYEVPVPTGANKRVTAVSPKEAEKFAEGADRDVIALTYRIMGGADADERMLVAGGLQ